MMTLQQLEQELIELPATERLRLARWLLDTLLTSPQIEQSVEAHDNDIQHSSSPLLCIAGRFHGGPGDTAEHAEEILMREIDATHGLGKR